MISRTCALSPRKDAVAHKTGNSAWDAATWKGSRRMQLRAALAMTIRERFQALEELTELAERLATMPRDLTRAAKRNSVAR
jgi:hypothetical protein